jgi:hypothetical protein
VFEWESSEASRPQGHVVHPITLDGVFQTILAALILGGNEAVPTAVPTRITGLWISGTGAAFPANPVLQVYARVDRQSSRSSTSCAFATDQQGRTLISIPAIETTYIDSTGASEENGTLNICYNIAWNPDIDLLGHSSTQKSFTSMASFAGVHHFQDMWHYFRNLCIEILENVDASTIPSSLSYLHHYVRWMETAKSATSAPFPAVSPSTSTDNPERAGIIYNSSVQVAEISAMGKALAVVGKSLPAILAGTQDPLEILFSSDLAKNIYVELNTRTQPFVRQLASLIAFKEPGLRVLEIGAGTGATTEHILEYSAIHTQDGEKISAIASYEFTDVSPAFFGPAKERFQDHLTKMKFSVLDISVDPIKQGFREGSYDLIVAANVSPLIQKKAQLLKSITGITCNRESEYHVTECAQTP